MLNNPVVFSNCRGAPLALGFLFNYIFAVKIKVLHLNFAPFVAVLSRLRFLVLRLVQYFQCQIFFIVNVIFIVL